ncbi:hypothetical protein FLA105534_03250 [Flavobacterium bizetiae]|uniref:Outer membrane protein beta-barrel domain-containing protein n=1 Tax=Flavobacterium bizetiae TaxID=2704140 RepID=A0A6J4GRL0_9FLAO|nr:porin family protein [Flavobacterium bizetiae]UTN04439.1 PorT family protein [Flavobacterium bizetiae]CAA9200784.1 hypothetical protein FLA105534_03250 [Flavobacterium bizetiae]CAD5341975.1 hypothetical protein FLA105535_01953 [Flavobacterium bizetiae]CAD5348241.1 hypothetical protein FLA105534_02201 [Flavobacterium bizetiae]
MKKVLLSAIAVMAFMSVSAQETRFGVKAGLNLSTLTGDAEDAKSLVGFQVGGFAEIKLTDKFAIQPEVLFSTQGAKFDDIEGDSKTKLNYINVPVLAKYFITEAFSVEAGPQIGFLVSAKSDGEDIKDFTKSVDFGFNLGAGYNFTENLSVGLRYTLGLSPVNDNGDDFEDYTVRNGNFALAVGYKF